MTYEQRLDTIVSNAWEQWTKNGLNMDEEMHRETEQTVYNAAANTYQDDMTDTDWLKATVTRLRG